MCSPYWIECDASDRWSGSIKSMKQFTNLWHLVNMDSLCIEAIELSALGSAWIPIVPRSLLLYVHINTKFRLHFSARFYTLFRFSHCHCYQCCAGTHTILIINLCFFPWIQFILRKYLSPNNIRPSHSLSWEFYGKLSIISFRRRKDKTTSLEQFSAIRWIVLC